MRRAYLFLAGGIGIAPLLPMIAALERRGASLVVRLCRPDGCVDGLRR